MSGEPPSETGAFHETVAVRPVAESIATSSGADGASSGNSVAAAVFELRALTAAVVMVTIFTK